MPRIASITSGSLTVRSVQTAYPILLHTVLNPNDNTGPASDQFGFSTDISSDYFVAGAPYEDGTYSNQGKIYVYSTTTGSELYRKSSNTLGFHEYGTSVATNGDRLVVGSPAGDIGLYSNRGFVEIYDIATNAFERKIEGPTAGANVYFGKKMAIHDDILVVGESLGANSNKFSMWRVDTGARISSSWLQAPAVDTGDFYGTESNVEMNDRYLAIGARAVDVGGIPEGKVYVYDMENRAANSLPTLLWTIDNPQSGVNDSFGQNISLEGDTLSISAKGSDRVYIVDLTTGNVTDTINIPAGYVDGDTSNTFGDSVSLGPQYLCVGDSSYGANEGIIHVFDRSDYSRVYSIENPNADGVSTSDQFGLAVDKNISIDGNKLVVGARETANNDADTLSGAVYVFQLHP